MKTIDKDYERFINRNISAEHGKNFLTSHADKFKIAFNDKGELWLHSFVDRGKVLLPLFPLDMADIYAQVTPAEIIRQVSESPVYSWLKITKDFLENPTAFFDVRKQENAEYD